MAPLYMNRFAINEDDQFEIHVKDNADKYWMQEKDSYNAAEEVMLKDTVPIPFSAENDSK